MSTFDQIIPVISEVLREHAEHLKILGPIVINRDLNGRIRLVLEEKLRNNTDAKMPLEAIVLAMVERLDRHGFPSENMVLYEPELLAVTQGAPHFQLEGFNDVTIVDRLATETDWGNIAPVSPSAPRIVFFSIKGGVGRSTALAVSAWSLAQTNKRVLVLDLDLESPGLSSALLPDERCPTFGITDWLVEDLVDNDEVVFNNMVATSDLSHDGEIYVVPAHGRNPGEYVAKLGRVWMSKARANGSPEPWSKRLSRLLNKLESHYQPNVILIDSRAGIDEVASACITDLGAHGVLLFAIDGEQTWSGYRILFRHWLQTGVARDIRERLQLVGAMIPDVEDRAEYFGGLQERAWDTFAEELYDEIPAGEPTGEHFSFDESDETAPHFPWPIRWHRGFAALQSFHSRFQRIDPDEVTSIFGPLIKGVHAIAEGEGVHHD